MFLKTKNIIFKIRRSKVTDYAALKNINFELTDVLLNYLIVGILTFMSTARIHFVLS